MRLACLLLLAGCSSVPDVCSGFGNCISLQVKGNIATVDQVQVTGLSGFKTTPGNAGVSPDPPSETALPLILAVVPPPEFSGDYLLDVRGFFRGVQQGQALAESSFAGGHQQISVTLGPPLSGPTPVVQTLDPAAACVGTAFDLALTGMDLQVVNSLAPTVHLGDQGADTSGCGVMDGTCNTITAHVAGLAKVGSEPLTVVNPPPDGIASVAQQFPVLPAPTISDVTTQGGNCVLIVVGGSGFYRVNGHEPRLRVDGVLHDASASGCVPVAGNVEKCASISVGDALPSGNRNISVVGAAPLDCPSKTFTLPCL